MQAAERTAIAEAKFSARSAGSAAIIVGEVEPGTPKGARPRGVTRSW